MDKFLITRKTANAITGPIMVTTSPRFTCPTVMRIPQRRRQLRLAGLCYAEHGALGGFVWTLLDRTPAGRTIMNDIRVYGFDELLYAIRSLPPGSLWRHNVAGDLPSNNQTTIDRAALRAIVDANRGRRGFTFTHYDVLTNLANRQAIEEANQNGFTHQPQRQLARACRPARRSAHRTRHRNSPCRHEAEHEDAERPNRRDLPDQHSTGVTCAACGLCARACAPPSSAFPPLVD